MEIRTSNATILRFGVFELDRESGELRRHGLKIRLPDQSFQILKTLLSRPGEVITREELRHVLWTSPFRFCSADHHWGAYVPSDAQHRLERKAVMLQGRVSGIGNPQGAWEF